LIARSGSVDNRAEGCTMMKFGRTGIAVAVLAVWGVLGALPMSRADAQEELLHGVEKLEGLSPAHMPGPIAYDRVPPAGGPHAPVWVNCGVYPQPVPVEMAVHSLEHGAVWITYRPDLPPPDVLALAALARGQTHVLVSPWAVTPPLPSAVVASAWGYQLLVDDAADPRLEEFVRNYVNGMLAPEPGAPCHGGAGTPLPNP
jgi:hypothetical protein